jgi:hypothetical protein
MFAQFSITKGNTVGVRRGKDPQCEFCQHITERAFSVTEGTHNVELPKSSKGIAFACVSCWSDLAI